MENNISEFENKPRHSRRYSSIWWGIVLIFVGVIFLAQRAGWLGPQYNWWALFIFIPAIGSLSGAFYAFQSSGRFNAAVRSSLGSGLVILTVAFIFLFGLNWAVYWPLMVIVGGFSMLLSGFNMREILSMSFWIGLGAMVLGAGFLAMNLNWYDVQAAFSPNRWWGIPILIPAGGALINALIAGVRGRGFGTVIGLITFGVMVAATGIVAFLGLDWNLLAPVLLIMVGVGILLGIFSRK
jgi:hypothetical protein